MHRKRVPRVPGEDGSVGGNCLFHDPVNFLFRCHCLCVGGLGMALATVFTRQDSFTTLMALFVLLTT